MNNGPFKDFVVTDEILSQAQSREDTISSPTSVLAVQEMSGTMTMIEPMALNSTSAGSLEMKIEQWVCPASQKSLRTNNPIRAIVDPILKNIQSGQQRGDGKDLISLALGDPTVSGNLPPCSLAIEKAMEAVKTKPHAAEYVNACGTTAAREAIAAFHSCKEHKIGMDNVIVANGCSGALEIALTTLLDPGTILLVPQPGFPLYQVISESHGARVLPYRLIPDRQWEVDLDHLEQLMSEFPSSLVRGILINNPSNPTGGVFSREHLAQIVRFCERHKLPIVADEVYGNLVFGDNTFHPMAKIAVEYGRKVPVITASGLAKQFLLPGWRVGWIAFHDNIYNSLAPVEAGAKRLAQVVLGASHLAQSVVPELLNSDSSLLMKWKLELRMKLEKQARQLCSALEKCHGLTVVPPQGAMYAMVRLSLEALDVADDMDFSSLLLQEENVFVLPGSAFGVPNVFRVVFCAEKAVLEEAANRIAKFCERHSVAESVT